MGPNASAATTRTDGSRIPPQFNAPLKSARRRACGNVDNANASPTVPQENKTGRSGHLMCYQNRTSSFAIDILCRGTIVDLGIGPLACEHGRGGRRDRFGQKAGLQGALWQGPERAPEPPLRRDGRESHWTSAEEEASQSKR